MPIIVSDSVAAETESLVLDGLELNDGDSYRLTELRLPIPAHKPEWVEGVDADGALLMRDPLRANGQMTVGLEIWAGDRDAVHVLVQQIVHKLAEASRTPSGIECDWTPKGGTTTGTFYVLRGEITEMPVDELVIESHVGRLSITLDCKPGMYGPRALYGTTTSGVTGPQVEVEVEDFPGDLPSDAAELIVTDTSSQSRRWVEWGAEYYHYDASLPSTLLLDSDSLTTSGYAGTQTTLAGAYDPGASGNSIISALVASSWQALAATGAQPHVGTFRVKARVNSGPGGCHAQFRLAWRVGDGQYETNNPYVLTTGVQAYHEVDLGTITVPVANAGTQSWEGRVDALSTTGGDTVYLDYIKLVPAREGYGKARAAYVEQPGYLVGRDEFTSTTSGSNLNARVAPAGGTWATSGATTDFQFADSGSLEHLSRGTISDTGEGRFAILGSTNYTDTEVQMRVAPGVRLASTTNQGAAVIVRWVDSSNYLAAGFFQHHTEGSNRLVLYQKVAGTVTVLGSILSGAYAGPGYWYRLKIGAVGSLATASMSTDSGTNLTTVSARSSDLATGGALDDGKPVINHVNNASSIGTAWLFDDIMVSQLPAEPIALYSGRTLEVRSDITERQSSGGTTYGRPNSYRGSRFVLNPAGTTGRTTRVAVTAYRNDVDAGGTAEHITDALKLEVWARPRWSVVPG
jgi:hypothetical protein